MKIFYEHLWAAALATAVIPEFREANAGCAIGQGDGQLQLEVDASRGGLDWRFRQAAQTKQEELVRQFRLGGLPLLLLDTAGDELRQLKAALAGHG